MGQRVGPKAFLFIFDRWKFSTVKCGSLQVDRASSPSRGSRLTRRYVETCKTARRCAASSKSETRRTFDCGRISTQKYIELLLTWVVFRADVDEQWFPRLYRIVKQIPDWLTRDAI